MPDIIYTKVDEAPELASASLLPIIRAFAGAADVSFGTKDISLAGRIIAAFPEGLSDAQKQSDDLAAVQGQRYVPYYFPATVGFGEVIRLQLCH